MAIARVHYLQDGEERFLKGDLLEENEDFVKILLDNYIVTLNRKAILKLEVHK